jgi:EmrB/QacA subfamily drug resistance transporter
MIPGAEVGDRIGRKRAYLIGLVVFAIASAGCALAPGIGLLIAARVVQGAGGALITPAALALLTAATPLHRRGAIMGVYAAVMGLAVVGGPLVGGAVTEGVAWQWIFWINVPVIALVLPFAAVKLPEMKGNPVRPDLLGLLLVASSMFCLVWALVRSGTAGWGSAEVLGTLVAGLVLLGGFVGWELATPHPMMPIKLFAAREFAAGNLSVLLLTASLFSTVFFLAQYLQFSLGYTPLAAGIRYLPWTVPLFFVAPLAGRVQDKVGPRWLILSGLLLQGLGLFWLAMAAHRGDGYSACVPALVVAGIGTSIAMPAQQSAVMAAVAPSSMGKAAGTFNTLRQLGGALGVAILAAVFAAHGSDRSPAQFADGFSAAIVASAVMALLGAAAGLLAPGRRRAPEPANRAGTAAAVRSVEEDAGVGVG